MPARVRTGQALSIKLGLWREEIGLMAGTEAAILSLWLACAGVAVLIAKDKNRSASEGVILGILLGFVGIFIEICLPRKSPK
jgi:VIT1/CCC1 family predicted Fe2+/Mn2+ transporter